ncbi:hypothetical protein Tcan_11232 [Toxocara canis]|uniref:Uncharacterized protein n=1 Tax=Toxocara canis TaxID=6265 RepID=A0A0B2V0K5_TOXCA|nr:hypothetical protein Tcan_11232 [Toxocara canis]
MINKARPGKHKKHEKQRHAPHDMICLAKIIGAMPIAICLSFALLLYPFKRDRFFQELDHGSVKKIRNFCVSVFPAGIIPEEIGLDYWIKWCMSIAYLSVSEVDFSVVLTDYIIL